MLSDYNRSVNASWHSLSVQGEGAVGNVTTGATASNNMSFQAASAQLPPCQLMPWLPICQSAGPQRPQEPQGPWGCACGQRICTWQDTCNSGQCGCSCGSCGISGCHCHR